MSTLVKKKRTTLPSLVNRIFETGHSFPGIFDYDTNLFGTRRESFLTPDANIVETSKDFKIDLAAPGLERNDFKVEVENGMLTISVQRDIKKEEQMNYRRREFSYNSFNRSFILPENCLPEKIDAKYENGILHIMLPKKEVTTSKPAKEIKVS